MDRINKVQASAGAEWLMGGFRLLRKSPLGLGLLGAIFGVLGLVAGLAVQSGAVTLGMLLQLVFILSGPLLLAGMIYAAREVDEGREASPAHLLRGVHDGRVPSLLATLLPQVGAVVLLILLLIVLIGPSQLQAMQPVLEELQGQATPDPALVEQLPVGRLLLWMVLAVLLGVIAGFFTFTAIAAIMFRGRPGLPAMGDSFRACIRNLPALLVFFLLLLIAAFALNIGALAVGVLVGALLGPAAMQMAMQVVMAAVLMPVVTGSMYYAWRQLHGDAASGASTHVPAGIEA